MSDLSVLIEGPLSPSEVEVQWLRAAATASPEAQAQIDQRWDAHVAEAVSKGRSLFNGAITRLIRAEKVRTPSHKVRLLLGPADYKTFIVTVMRDRVWFLANAPEAMAYALGNSVLLTQGDRALLGIRSSETSAYAGRAHVIGGVLELLGSANLPASVDGILTHLRREMLEEAAVGEEELAASPVMLAIVQDAFLAQPEIIWQWEVSSDLQKIAERLDVHEHHGAVIIEKKAVPPATYEQMTPVARAAWERWRSR